MKNLRLLLSVLCIGASGATAWASPERLHPNLRTCGVYSAGGDLRCEHGKCSLTVNPGTLAEIQLELVNTTPAFARLSGAYVRTRVRIEHLSSSRAVAFVEDKAPLRALRPLTSDDFNLVKGRKCKR